jgi:hypothetical protein
MITNKYPCDELNYFHTMIQTSFREDEQRKRAHHAAKNFAIIRKIGLKLLKKDTGQEISRTKRLKAAWNKDFLINLIKI